MILVSTYSNVNENPFSGDAEGFNFACNGIIIGIHVDGVMTRYRGSIMIMNGGRVKAGL